jgi:hypothetical protein
MPFPRELITPRDHRHGSRLGDVIRRLASNSQGEAFAALCAIARLLQAYGQSFHTLAEHVENANGGGLSDADKQKISAAIENARAIGYAEGVAAAESKQHGTGVFRNTDGALEWTEVALFVQRQKHRLPDRHYEFINDMAARTVWGHEPTPKQHQYLHSLFYKLGGKIT